ncbi:MAG: NAD-dependent epimerase/dehydratase family protein [Chitinophagales bacterium]|nr:NAD-dependent epimerase/dehydratase family protein [Chitinophagales bacterium]
MVLVTGATGLVGSYLTKYLLKANKQVRAIKRPSSDLSLLGDYVAQIEWVDGDVLDIVSLEDAMQGVEQVYHAAAFISFRPSQRQQMLKINAEGTANVVNVALQQGIKKLLYFSSVTALGTSKHGEILDEKSEVLDADYDSSYGLSKYLGEIEVWRGMLEGLKAVIVNPSLILGAGRWSDSSLKLFSQVDHGIDFYPVGSNGYVDVRDVAQVAIRLMDSDIINERFILNAENLSYREVIGQIADNFKVKKPTKALSGAITTLAVLAERTRSLFSNTEPALNSEIAQLITERHTYSNEKIKQRFAYQFIPIEQSLRECCQAYMESKKAGQAYATLPL